MFLHAWQTIKWHYIIRVVNFISTYSLWKHTKLFHASCLYKRFLHYPIFNNLNTMFIIIIIIIIMFWILNLFSPISY